MYVFMIFYEDFGRAASSRFALPRVGLSAPAPFFLAARSAREAHSRAPHVQGASSRKLYIFKKSKIFFKFVN
jgi:hypothetical protein